MSSAGATERFPDTADRIGHNRLTHAAIRKTVETVTAQAFRVGTGDVSATVEDDAGRLGVKVSIRLSLPPLLKQSPTPRKPQPGPATVFEQARAARQEIVARGTAITGLAIGRVDIRLTGGKPGRLKERRVE